MLAVSFLQLPRSAASAANLAIPRVSCARSGTKKRTSRRAIELLVAVPVMPLTALIPVPVPRRLRYSSGIDSIAASASPTLMLAANAACLDAASPSPSPSFPFPFSFPFPLLAAFFTMSGANAALLPPAPSIVYSTARGGFPPSCSLVRRSAFAFSCIGMIRSFPFSPAAGMQPAS